MRMDDEAFKKALMGTKIPVLVLDQKWHRLFAISGKPQEVKDAEVEINEMMAKQAKVSEEVKRLKKIKNDLMEQIREHMGGVEAEDESDEDAKALEETRRLLDETTERLAADEDELLELPRSINDKNNELMLLTMEFTYDKLRSNTDEINEISKWIADVRVNLKKNIIKKQNREINNTEMYAYMHDLFGKDVMQVFDVHYDEDGKLILKEHLEQEQIDAARGKGKELMES